MVIIFDRFSYSFPPSSLSRAPLKRRPLKPAPKGESLPSSVGGVSRFPSPYCFWDSFLVAMKLIFRYHFFRNLQRPTIVSAFCRRLQLPFITSHGNHYSSSSEWAEQSKELVDYLVNSCGFPSESARFVCARLGRRARILKAMKAIGFFREIGFTDAQIRKSLSRKPLLLATKVDETLKPKVRTFLDWGLSSHDIAHIVSRNPFILAINLRNRILPVVGLIRELLPQNDDAVRSIKALFSVPLFSTDTKEMMETNVAILRARGVPDRTLSRILRSWPRLLSWTPSSLEKMVARVHKMGFDYSSGLFPAALSTVAAMGDSVWEAKLEVFTEFGWSRENISTAFQKAPFLLVSSGNLLRKKLKFFMVELEITPSELAATPRLLLHNMDRRIVPRVMVLRFLIDKNLIRKRKHSLRAILLMKDEDFYNKFVLAHKDECPEMFEVYMKSSKVEISRKFG